MKLSTFLSKHRLPEEYRDDIDRWFTPLAKVLAERQAASGKAFIIGISGAQGSGKSTLADLLGVLCEDQYHLKTIVLSIDDFYLTRHERKGLATKIHPLMATRGVPGTHDMVLALDTVTALVEGIRPVKVPRFDKAKDDRVLPEQWESVAPGADLIILEGWCLGAEAQSEAELLEPVNDLEKHEDIDGVWRNYVNRQLEQDYRSLFSLIDYWVMLKAPSFNCVYQWRLEQENKLKSSLSHADMKESSGVMDANLVSQFIQYYQRITQQLLKVLPGKVDTLFDLNEDRKIISSQLKR